MGITLKYVCWGTHRPPPGSPAAKRRTRRPPRFGSTKAPPPPTTPKRIAHPSGSHIGWRRPPWSANWVGVRINNRHKNDITAFLHFVVQLEHGTDDEGDPCVKFGQVVQLKLVLI